MNRIYLLAVMVYLYACTAQKPPENSDAWKKIKLDFKQIDANGMTGSEKSKVVVNYEFCIPAKEENWRKVRKIDATAQKNEGRGRVACKDQQWLVIGAANQKNYQRVLFELASLPFIERIEPVFWE